MRAQLLSVHAGMIRPQQFGARIKRTAIVKAALAGAVNVGALGVDGDEQGDKRNHGGPAQAICVYPSEHYVHWQQRLGHELPRAGFGENFVTEGVTEETVCIGDIFRAGSVTLQVTQPRGPCATLAAYLEEPRMVQWARENGLTGWYMRVLSTGSLQAGDAFLLEARPGTGVTVMDVNAAMVRPQQDVGRTGRVLAEELLLGKWRGRLRKLGPELEITSAGPWAGR